MRWHPALAALCVALALVATACGGGSSPVQDYFRLVDQLNDTYEEETNRLNDELASLSEEEANLRGPDIIEQQFDAFGTFAAGLAALEPPAEVADAHGEAVQAAQAFLAVFRDLIGGLGDAPTLNELVPLLQREDFSDAGQRLREGCSNLAQIADDNGISVDLAC